MTPVVRPMRRGVVFDAGALVALDRHDRGLWAMLRDAEHRGRLPIVPAPVLTQVWGSGRQANLARALRFCAEQVVDWDLGREAGELCAAARTRDAVDAIVVATAARHRATVVTSDPDDIAHLARHTSGVRIDRA